MSTSEKTFWKFGLVIQKIFRSIETKILIKSYVTKEKERERERDKGRERKRNSKRKREKEQEKERERERGREKLFEFVCIR